LNLETRAAQLHARLPREPHLHNKRALASQARELLEALDADPAEIELMLERHRLELPERPFSLTGEQPPPARDPFVEIGAERPGPHAELNAALLRAEVAAATTAEVDLPTRLALARFADDELQRTAELDAELEEPWGSEPVDVSAYARLMAASASDRIQQLLGERARGDEDAAL
jgi:hypothetical protein